MLLCGLCIALGTIFDFTKRNETKRTCFCPSPTYADIPQLGGAIRTRFDILLSAQPCWLNHVGYMSFDRCMQAT